MLSLVRGLWAFKGSLIMCRCKLAPEEGGGYPSYLF